MNIYFNFISGLRHELGAMPHTSGDALRSSMEAENARWLSAFNQQHVEEFGETYTADAALIHPGELISNGPRAIGEFWHVRIKASVREHTFEVLVINAAVAEFAKWTFS